MKDFVTSSLGVVAALMPKVVVMKSQSFHGVKKNAMDCIRAICNASSFLTGVLHEH
jgi:hypothetical protein